MIKIECSPVAVVMNVTILFFEKSRKFLLCQNNFVILRLVFRDKDFITIIIKVNLSENESEIIGIDAFYGIRHCCKCSREQTV